MSLTHAAFALAGLIAAAGPVIIHLLNRRRFRTVEWGAMAFLRKAMQRTRRSLRLRDLLLLALRTAALLLFGLALARPVLASGGVSGARLALLAAAVLTTFGGGIALALARTRARKAGATAVTLAGIAGLVALVTGPGWESASAADAASSRQPVHAILVIDNSRSMAARTLGGTLLDAAKRRAAAALGSLPPGSRVAVLPLCGPERSYTLDAHPHADDARAAIDRIAVTDRGGSALRMFSLAAEAAGRAPDLPAKRIVFVGDLQATGWPREGVADAAKSAGGPVQVVQVAEAGGGRTSADPPNVWIESFDVQDGLVESDQPATFLATVRCAGGEPVDGVEVTLTLTGTAAASQTVDLRPGQAREVVLTAPVEADAEPGTPAFVPATIALRVPDPAANRLERDDARHLAVPVVTALPVVFVDQYGDDESLDAGRVGETYRLRRLLAPRPAEGVYDPLVAVRHVTIEGLNETTLADARLVVVAGVERPTDEAVRLLRQYVEQGGPLVIAAGANFDPAAWTAAAWLDGRGVLPAPLAETPAGVRPSQATAGVRIEPFRLDAASLDHPLFRIAGEPAEALADLWGQPFFFQAVAADVSEETVRRAVAAEAERIAAERKALAGGAAAAADLAPSWLLWRTEGRAAGGDDPDADRPGGLSPDELASRTVPRVLARFARPGPDGVNLPYLVERRLGYGRVLMLTAGVSSDWDTLAQTNAIVLLDRVVRSLIEETLPRRAFEAGEPVTLPVERRPDVGYAVTPPGGEPRPVSLDATGDGYAVRLDDTSLAGTYALTARLGSGEGEPVEATALAVNGPPEESDLTPLSPDKLAGRVGDADVTFVGPDEPVTITGGPARGDGLWKWLAGAVLACLLAEMAVAGRSRQSGSLAASAPEAA